MKRKKWKILGEKVDSFLCNNINPSLYHFDVVSKRLGISSLCAQRSWNIYKGYIKESKHKIDKIKNDKVNEIDKYILKDDIIEGDISSIIDQIKEMLKEI